MNPPDQSPDDVRLARVLWREVAQQPCYLFHDGGGWEPVTDEGTALPLLWCYLDWSGDMWWRVVPAYGEDEAAAFRALNWYCERKRLYSQIDYVPPEGDMPAERYVILQRLGGRGRIVAEGSTFPLAARAAILAMEGIR